MVSFLVWPALNIPTMESITVDLLYDQKSDRYISASGKVLGPIL